MSKQHQSPFAPAAMVDDEPHMGVALVSDGHLEMAAHEREIGIAALKQIAARIAERSYPTGP